MNYSVSRIAGIIKADDYISQEASISHLLTDSRSLSDPFHTLFFALVTSYNDGHRYIRELYAKGVRNFVVQKGYDVLLPGHANILYVDDPITALQQLTTYHRQQFTIPIIGITGSSGKTVTKEWLYRLLYEDFKITRSPRSYNSQIGVPLSVWQINEKTELGIFEAGISRLGEMERLASVIRPTIGILTNLGEKHQENFSSKEEKCMEKILLFRDADVLIYNEDDELITACLRSAGLTGKGIAWSKKNRSAAFYIEKIVKEETASTVFFIRNGNRDSVTFPFADELSVECGIHCLVTVYALFPGIADLAERFARLEPVSIRFEIKTGVRQCILISDPFNSDVYSLDLALDFMLRRLSGKKKNTVLILSDIEQSDIESEAYSRVADLVKEKEIDRLIGIGKEITACAGFFPEEKYFYPTTEAFLSGFDFQTLSDSVILIKGAPDFRFGLISERLEEKVHETVLEVNLNAIIQNYNYFRSLLKRDTKIICMIKAFGYGIGSYELAKTLQDQGCAYLAVAIADEGMELRREGITTSIMVMNPEMSGFNTLFEYKLEPEIYNFRILDAMIKEAEKKGITDYPVHIKLNTGMNRLGFDPEDMDLLSAKLKKQNHIKVCSVFSHLAGSDSAAFDSYTKEQADLFYRLATRLKEELGYPVWFHLDNSAGIERFSTYQFDMVRLGIGLYGISAVKNPALKSVASLKTTILQIRNVKAGETVGYSRKWEVVRDSRIACLPVGYADGLDRRLSNGIGKVMVHGVRCPIVGNICMDLCMVDVTDITVSEGDEAIIFGEEITVEELARQLDTIPYEILTSVSPRVKRIYFKQ